MVQKLGEKKMKLLCMFEKRSNFLLNEHARGSFNFQKNEYTLAEYIGNV